MLRFSLCLLQIFWKGNTIEHVTCSCVRGQKHCGHIAALLVYAEKNISCTDVSCSWARPKTVDEAEKETRPIDELFPRTNNYSAIDTVNADIWNRVRHKLSSCGDAAAGVRFLLSDEPERPVERISVVNVRDLILSEEFRLAENKVSFLESKLGASLIFLLYFLFVFFFLFLVCTVYMQYIQVGPRILSKSFHYVLDIMDNFSRISRNIFVEFRDIIPGT